MNFSSLLLPAIVACSCNALANMFWKMRFDKVPLSLSSIQDLLDLLKAWQIWIGIGCYGVSMLLFFYMLSHYKLSSIMPVTCMTYIFNIIIARFFFYESISKTQIIGAVIIIIGLLILSRGQITKI